MSLPERMRYIDHGAGGPPEAMALRHRPLPTPARARC